MSFFCLFEWQDKIYNLFLEKQVSLGCASNWVLYSGVFLYVYIRTKEWLEMCKFLKVLSFLELCRHFLFMELKAHLIYIFWNYFGREMNIS